MVVRSSYPRWLASSHVRAPPGGATERTAQKIHTRQAPVGAVRAVANFFRVPSRPIRPCTRTAGPPRATHRARGLRPPARAARRRVDPDERIAGHPRAGIPFRFPMQLQTFVGGAIPILMIISLRTMYRLSRRIVLGTELWDRHRKIQYKYQCFVYHANSPSDRQTIQTGFGPGVRNYVYIQTYVCCCVRAGAPSSWGADGGHATATCAQGRLGPNRVRRLSPSASVVPAQPLSLSLCSCGSARRAPLAATTTSCLLYLCLLIVLCHVQRPGASALLHRGRARS
eukprot:COSAG02_NODE_8067_length_2722_cov_2.277545_2_plen_284_part_00